VGRGGERESPFINLPLKYIELNTMKYHKSPLIKRHSNPSFN
jgi:hypothetical protein